MIKICSYLLMSMLFFQSNDNPKIKELKAYYSANLKTFKKQNATGNLQLECAYYPIQLIQKEQHIAASKSKNREYTFQLLISANGKEDFLKASSDTLSFEEKIIYYSSDFQKDIQVKLDGKAIGNPAYYSFERSHFSGLPAKCIMSLVIPTKTKRLEISVNDRIFDKTVDCFEFDMQAVEAFDKKVAQTLTKKTN